MFWLCIAWLHHSYYAPTPSKQASRQLKETMASLKNLFWKFFFHIFNAFFSRFYALSRTWKEGALQLRVVSLKVFCSSLKWEGQRWWKIMILFFVAKFKGWFWLYAMVRWLCTTFFSWFHTPMIKLESYNYAGIKHPSFQVEHNPVFSRIKTSWISFEISKLLVDPYSIFI